MQTDWNWTCFRKFLTHAVSYDDCLCVSLRCSGANLSIFSICRIFWSFSLIFMYFSFILRKRPSSIAILLAVWPCFLTDFVEHAFQYSFGLCEWSWTGDSQHITLNVLEPCTREQERFIVVTILAISTQALYLLLDSHSSLIVHLFLMTN